MQNETLIQFFPSGLQEDSKHPVQQLFNPSEFMPLDPTQEIIFPPELMVRSTCESKSDESYEIHLIQYFKIALVSYIFYIYICLIC